MSNTGWMRSSPLGSLASTTDEINYFNEPKIEKLTKLSSEKLSLLEDYRSGLISTKEFRYELNQLKQNEKLEISGE